jgi:hypothetical protein
MAEEPAVEVAWSLEGRELAGVPTEAIAKETGISSREKRGTEAMVICAW